MKRFDTMLEAAEYAATRCNRWGFINTDEEYDAGSLTGIAEISDDEHPADEGSFYVVSPGGAIGICGDGGVMEWLFLADSGTGEDLPATFRAAANVNFCPKCGSGVVPGARFCGKCGNRL